MATIAAGAVQTVTCPAGTGLQFSGGATGLVTYLAPGIHPGTSTTLANRNAIGPFSSTQTLSIQVDATSRALVYTSSTATASPNVTQNPITGALSGPAGVLQTGAARRLLSLKLLQPTSTTANGYSWHLSRTFIGNIVAVKFRIHNAATTTLAAFSAAFGYSDNVANQNTPSAGWNPMMFSGASSYAGASPITVAAAVSGGGTNSAVLSYLDSDIHYLGSIPRADGGQGSVIHVRGTWPTGTGTRASGASPSATLAADGVWSGFQSGDLVSSAQGSFTSTTYGPGPAIEIIAYTAEDLMYGMAIGDSITLGFEATSFGGWKRFATDNLTASGKLVHIADWGASGSTSNAFTINGMTAIANTPPTFAIYFPGSPNDTDKYTAPAVTRHLLDISTFLAACAVNGVRYPILATLAPEQGINSTQEGFRRQTCANVRARCQGNVILADFDSWWTDYTNPAGGWKLDPNGVSYQGGAAVHPNQAADILAGANIAAILTKLF